MSPQKSSRNSVINHPSHERYFGLHFDLHAGNQDRELGQQVSPALVERIIRDAKPDFIQYDCKGHCGYLAYPRSKVSQTAGGPGGKGIIRDSIAIYRRVTRRHGVDLYMHFSGVWDDVATRDHPEWAAIDAKGKPQPRATSLFSPYVKQRMIPQLLEVIQRYGVDGFWVDGDCWAVQLDYCPQAVALFRQRTGLKKAPTQPGQPGWLEWTNLHRERFVQYVQTYVQAVHEAHPNVRMASNWFHSGLCPVPAGVAPVDYISGDYSPFNAVDTARFDARQMASAGMPWDLMAWGFCTIPGTGTTHKPAVQLCQESAQVLAQGGGFQFYYYPDRDGGFSEYQLQTIKQVAEFCRPRKSSCFQSDTVPQVAILLDTHSLWTNSPAVARTWRGEYRAMHGVLQGCIEAGHSVDILADHQLDKKLNNYPVLVVPQWADMSKSTIARLKDYVNRGGSLLLIGAATARCFRDLLGADLQGQSQSTDATLHLANPRLTGACDGLWQAIHPRPGTLVMATRTIKFNQDRSPTPAATLNRWGKGKIAAVYGPLGNSLYNSHSRALRQVLANILARLYQPAVTLQPGSYGKVDLVLRQKDQALCVHLLNVNNMPTSECAPNQEGNAVASGGNYPLVDRIPEVGLITIQLHRPTAARTAKLEPQGLRLPVQTTARGRFITIPKLHLHSVVVVR